MSASDEGSLIAVLQRCRHDRDTHQARRLLAYLRLRRLHLRPALGNYLVPALVDCGCLPDAQDVFDHLPLRAEHSWTSLISGYSESGRPQDALHLYRTMQQENSAQPSRFTLVALLNACAKLEDADIGRSVHNEATKRGLDNELYVGSTLVDMYGKCGLLPEARRVFDCLLARDAVSWTTLIAGYADQGFGKEVLDCFKRMRMQGVCADPIAFACSLKACGSIGAFPTGQEIHAEIILRGLERERSVGSMLVDMYGKCHSFMEAQQVFNRLPIQDTTSWNSLIAGHAENGNAEAALNCFRKMQLEGIHADSTTFVLCLKACVAVGAIDIGREIHAEIRRSGLERDPVVGDMLVDMYGKCGFIKEGREAFEKLTVHGVISWTIMLDAYVHNREGDMAMRCYEEMQHQGVPANSITYVICLKACATIGTGQGMHSEIVMRGLENDIHVGSTLVDVYVKSFSLSEAQHTFDRLPVRNAVSWTALLAGYAEQGLGEKVLNCLKQMQVEGVSADAATFVLCLKACGNIGALETGRELHVEIRKSGLEKNPFVGNALIDMYGKCGSVVEGREVFDRLPARHVIPWTAMIKAYGENQQGNMAVLCFEKMLEQGVKPDGVAFTCLLAACSRANLVLEGQEYFMMMSKEYGIKPSLDHYSCMVDLFARSGNVCEAERFLAAMQCPPSHEILMALLSACKLYGKVEVGERCFQQLVEVNQEDASAYSLMADIYASAGRWSDAMYIAVMRNYAGARKTPGSAIIELNRMSHNFVVGSKQSKVILELLESFKSHMKAEGYVPNVAFVLDIENKDKFVDTHQGHV